MGVFGDRLRREREMRGVTLEEISESTKISKRSLQAMEEEDFDLLPGGIFNKGFVRAYARFLGIDEEQAVADFLAVSNEQQAAEDKFPLELNDNAQQPPLNPKRSLLPVILALVVLVAVAGAWTFWNKHKAQENAAESQSNPVSKASDQPGSAPVTPPANNSNGASSPANQTAENPNSAGPDRQNPSAESTTSGNGSSAAAERTSGERSSNERPAGERTSDKRPAKPLAAQPPPATDSTGKKNPSTEFSGANEQSSLDSADPAQASKAFTVSVKATEDSWISIVADGKQKMEGILNAEKQQSVRAGKELVLVTGNAGGIEVSYNGKPMAPLGKKQQKKTVTFTTHGIQQ
ncbi:MAG TPA: RodZ domain-containing protein [Candidatus Solibacter sp.]|nr:RodZ domain-containing protein [Candidatus Solibacter sp.]